MKPSSICDHVRAALKPSALAVATVSLLVAGTALAVPANDDFANAIALTGGGAGQTGNVTSGTQTGTDNVDATQESGEIVGSGGINTVWFNWTCPADGELTVTTLGSTNSTPAEWDAVLGIYTGASVNALTPLGGSPQDVDFHEEMTVPVTAGTTYHIQTAGFGAEVAANILLNWNFVATVYEAEILTFGPYYANIGAVAANAANIAWTVPFGSNLATLAPTFTLSPGATCTVGGSPVVSGTPVNFSGGPRVFTVTAQGGSPINSYTVTVTLAPNESALVWNLASGGDWDFVTANWLGQTSLTTQPFANVLNVIFDNTSGGAINIPASVYPLSTTVSATSGTYTFSGGPLAGTGSLTKSGNGNLTITTTNNTFSGGTVINAGQLKMDVLANAALGTGPVTLNGGRLFLERITATNALIVNGGNLWPDNGFGNNWNGPVTLNSNLIIQGPVYATTTFNGPIGGAGGLTINGEGPIVLAVANSYTGPTSVTACTLTCNNVDALGSGTLNISSTANSKVNLNYSGTKNIAGLILGGIAQTGGTHGSTASDATFKSDTYFSGTGTVTVPLSSAKDILTFSFGVLGAATVNDSTITLEVPPGTDRTNLAPTYTVSPGASGSPVSGTPRNFTIPQTYTITAQDLSTKDYTVTVIETVLPDIFTWANAAAGNWSVGSNWTNELTTGSAPLASGRSSYTLNFNAPGTYTATNNLSVTGFQLNKLNLAATVTLAGNPLAFVTNGPTLPTINQNSGSAVTISNNLDFGDDMTFGGSAGGQVTLSGTISGDGKLTKNGTGTLICAANNSYSGGTVITSGTMRVNHVNPANTTGLGSGPISLDGGTLYMFRVTLNNALTVNGGSLTSENGFNQNQLNGPVTLNATLPILAPFQLTFSNTISGTGGLTKTGGGLMILSNTCTSTYSGPTTISAGTFRCDRPEAVSGSSAISISGTGKMNLNYVGTKTVATLTLGGVAQTTPGTYGSVASGANFQNDTYFTTGSTGTLTVAVSDPYAAWSGGGAFGADANNDGVKNGMAWVLGAANKEANAVVLQPLLDNTTDPTYFIFTYRRADAAETDPKTTILVEYGSNLGTWAPATAGPNIIITPTDNFYGVSPGVDKVEVKINRTLAVGGKLFTRLKVVKAP